MLELVAVVTTHIDFYSLRSSILANKLKNSQSFGAHHSEPACYKRYLSAFTSLF